MSMPRKKPSMWAVTVQRVVARYDNVAPARFSDGRYQIGHHPITGDFLVDGYLPLLEAVWLFEPPLRIDADETQLIAPVYELRAWCSTRRVETSKTTTIRQHSKLVNENFLPENAPRTPSVVVVVAW